MYKKICFEKTASVIKINNLLFSLKTENKKRTKIIREIYENLLTFFIVVSISGRYLRILFQQFLTATSYKFF